MIENHQQSQKNTNELPHNKKHQHLTNTALTRQYSLSTFDL